MLSPVSLFEFCSTTTFFFLNVCDTFFLSLCKIYIMCNYLVIANVTRKRFDCNIILFVFYKLHPMHNWAKS